MEPEAKPTQEAPAPVAPPTTTNAEPEIVLSDEAKAAGFTADDFKHPEYGKKAKSLYDGFQKATTARSQAQKEAQEIKAFIQSNPDVLKIVKETYRSLQGLPPEEEPTEGTKAEEPDAADLFDAKLALSELYAELGNGKSSAGRAKYFERDANGVSLCDRVEAELRLMNPSIPPAEKIRIAMSRVGPHVSNTTKPDTPPDTTARNESERGAGGTPPSRDPSKMTDEEIIQRALKKGGYPDLPTFLMGTSLTDRARLSGQMR